MACEKVVPSGLYILAATPPRQAKLSPSRWQRFLSSIMATGRAPFVTFYMQSNVITVSHRFVSITCSSLACWGRGATLFVCHGAGHPGPVFVSPFCVLLSLGAGGLVHATFFVGGKM